MKTITRNPNPPECLDQQSAEQGWREFMLTECHRLVSESLRAEQHHICCYCETAITAEADYMIGYMGLGCPRLTGRRRAHARLLMDTLGPNPDPAIRAWAVAYYLESDQDGRLQPFQSLSKTILEP